MEKRRAFQDRHAGLVVYSHGCRQSEDEGNRDRGRTKNTG